MKRLRLLAAGQKQSRAEKPTDERQGAKTAERRGQRQIMGEIADVNIRKAAPRLKRLVARGIPDCDMTLDLPEDTRFPQALHEVLPIRRVQI